MERYKQQRRNGEPESLGEIGLAEQFPKDPSTGLLPSMALRTQAGIDSINEQIGACESVLLQFRDQSGLSILGRFGFYNTADIVLAEQRPFNAKDIISIRFAGDEFVDIVFGADAQERLKSLRTLYSAVVHGTLGHFLTPDTRYYVDRSRSLALEGDEVERFRNQLSDIEDNRMECAKTFAGYKAALRFLRQEYLESVGRGVATTDGFRGFLLDRYEQSENRAKSLNELVRSIIDENEKLRKTVPIGSFEGATIEIQMPLTEEKIKRALVQAEVLLHRVKKNPSDSDARRALDEIHQLDETRPLRDVDNTEIAIVREVNDKISALRTRLSDSMNEDEKIALIQELRRLEFCDPSVPECVREPRLKGETVSFIVPHEVIDVAIFDIQAFQVINNAVGYAHADEIFRGVVQSLQKSFPDGVFCRIPGGTIALFYPPGQIENVCMHEVVLEAANALGNIINTLPRNVRTRIELELLEREVLNTLAGELELQYQQTIDRIVSDKPQIASELKSKFTFKKPQEKFPYIKASLHRGIHSIDLKFDEVIELHARSVVPINAQDNAL